MQTQSASLPPSTTLPKECLRAEVRWGSRTVAARPPFLTRFFLPSSVSLPPFYGLVVVRFASCRAGSRPSSPAPARSGEPRSSRPLLACGVASWHYRSAVAGSGTTPTGSSASFRFGSILCRSMLGRPPVASSSCGSPDSGHGRA